MMNVCTFIHALWSVPVDIFQCTDGILSVVCLYYGYYLMEDCIDGCQFNYSAVILVGTETWHCIEAPGVEMAADLTVVLEGL